MMTALGAVFIVYVCVCVCVCVRVCVLLQAAHLHSGAQGGDPWLGTACLDMHICLAGASSAVPRVVGCAFGGATAATHSAAAARARTWV
jgi:hypothetical protein